MLNNPERVITQMEVANIFGDAYLKSCTVEKAVNAFRSCGITPLNRFIFSDEDFLPSSVTDQTPIEEEIEDQVPHQTADTMDDESSSDDDIPLIVLTKKSQEAIKLKPGPKGSPKASTSKECQPSTPKECQPSTSRECQLSTSRECETSLSMECQPNKASSLVLNPVCLEHMEKSILKSPHDLMPYPRLTKFRQRRRAGKASKILTSTPNKEELENERKQKV